MMSTSVCMADYPQRVLGHWLVWMEWCPAGWSMSLPRLIFRCTHEVQKFWHRLTWVVPEKGRKTVVVCNGG